jgi:hypothetical protein
VSLALGGAGRAAAEAAHHLLQHGQRSRLRDRVCGLGARREPPPEGVAVVAQPERPLGRRLHPGPGVRPELHPGRPAARRQRTHPREALDGGGRPRAEAYATATGLAGRAGAAPGVQSPTQSCLPCTLAARGRGGAEPPAVPRPREHHRAQVHARGPQRQARTERVAERAAGQREAEGVVHADRGREEVEAAARGE